MQTASATVTVLILDANDNVPKFTETNQTYVFAITEGQPSGTYVGQVQVGMLLSSCSLALLYAFVLPRSVPFWSTRTYLAFWSSLGTL